MSENPVESKSSDSSSPGDAVVNWDRIIHKNVRTLDNQGMGKVIAVPNDEDTIIISSQGGGEQYKIPRSLVSGFNGAEVLLNQTAYQISSSSYKVDSARAYEAKPSDITTEERQQEQEETTVPLIEERLNVSKTTSTTQYTIRKEPVAEKKTIEVPVNREEVEVTKEPFVKEEVVVKKKSISETRTVSDTVTKERINTSGAATERQGIMGTE